MSEWWTYRPSDFLLFSARTYWRLFELHNAQSDEFLAGRLPVPQGLEQPSIKPGGHEPVLFGDHRVESVTSVHES